MTTAESWVQIPGGWVLRAIADEREQETIDDGITAAVRQFYADYTDATSLDPSFRAALDKIGEYGMREVDDIVYDAELAVAGETGRHFDSFDQPREDDQ